MKVIETNHDGRKIYNSLEQFAADILPELGSEAVLNSYLEEDDLIKFYDFDNQVEIEQIRLLNYFKQDFTFIIIK